ncbi:MULTISPECIES: type II toxin-antitoxin system YhaV family toxin [Photorhabdus]|uniref:Type II toxin-antitoxin system YhaV family toxin n=1 Tax=Photorhabdus bodei TaxID=2029681 RepID=A0AAW6BJM0_9GAMM|nr:MULTISPECIES: type II toxin-antitoxin system YhaV family toxin [Photorhabdus]MCT8352936.1 type II toxin-antitoxin system YhaV family toxin [Photorhabdus kayaii]MDB6368317.1 type II toxin-antitoxin system YhaV family toxin [Photorhabdus bodei]MDB6372918.1 type II toxin-antitoxin system YhaV family toxin [Photorhabdus bodei]
MYDRVCVINGWALFAHPCFIEQLKQAIDKVVQLQQKYPNDYLKKNDTKRLAAIIKLVTEIIPNDPANIAFRLGDTLGGKRKHWFRAKFFQQYRLFFRFHAESKIIIFGWVNDERTKRAYGDKHDAYKVFGEMLNVGHPPDDWNSLLKESIDSPHLTEFINDEDILDVVRERTKNPAKQIRINLDEI